jgi:hypothetical protein
VSGRRFAGAGAWNQRGDAHHAHQPLHVFAVDRMAFALEFERHPSRAVERQIEMQFVDAAHHGEIVRCHRGFGPVDARARQLQQFALAAHGKIIVGRVNHRPSIRRTHRPDLFAKKSRSTVSWPILAYKLVASRSRSSAPSSEPAAEDRRIVH